ncbi:SigB/SigF/SigG family RNA polymerase sigma factor [Patulibacter americanus]|uniref:SigB/SigF/SigG family RNA polymerase sigma factor n=1 Tax=Patulibacter americanus TaxID=588672 RepID=UPI0003B51170|nr:SigB/SigF/SigG family RNA polymerase sigma factor [Patulibacter americanus]
MSEDVLRRDRRDLDLLRRYHDRGDLRARDEMVRRAMPLVRSIARRYADRGEPLDDLVQVGCLGLVKAIDRFDPHAGHRFISFAAPNVSGEIKRHFRDHSWAVHVPRAAQELAAKIHIVQRRWADAVGREPTVEELCRELGEPADRVVDAIAAGRAYRAAPLERPAADGDGVVYELHGREDPGFSTVEDRHYVEQATRALDPRSRRVVEERFYDERLQREIAGGIGVSQMQVSRILDNALRQMRQELETPAAGGELLAA